mmetsp:Transcript_17409/g.33540  ORF Transcript_17409/g.33540 Transcript_17409/m.33540 type:complete len:202 (+) Transcript_17409:379-984(+)
MPDALEMATKLVLATRAWPKVNLCDPPMLQRAHMLACKVRGCRVSTIQLGADVAFPFKPSHHQRHVSLLHPALLKRRAQKLQSLPRLGRHHNPASGGVQAMTMHGGEGSVRKARALQALPNGSLHCLPATVHLHSRWLQHHCHVVIFIKDIEGGANFLPFFRRQQLYFVPHLNFPDTSSKRIVYKHTFLSARLASTCGTWE